ncbi:MAG: LPS-assembly protein LptD [Cyclobacteriaceae bacterium]
MRRVILVCVGAILSFFATAQNDSTQLLSVASDSSVRNDSLIRSGSDSLKFIVGDSAITPISDSLKASRPSWAGQPRGDIETTINYKSKDSIYFDLRGQTLRMYGESHIDYGDIELDAERTNVSMHNRTITSTFTEDSSGRKIGKPVFTDKGDVYETDHMIYNFNTKRAQIKGVITEQEGAFMHGTDVKKNEKNEMFIRGARYTTCNLGDPHFYIESNKIKVIPKDKIVAGPFNLKFRNVTTPLALPFGMFPQPKKKVSGIVFPTYGEEKVRGFFLREGGYYWAISDYMDLRATGDIYSRGGYGITTNTNYKKRYKYSGALNFSYNRTLSDDVENPRDSKDFWVRFNHRPETRGNSSFSASVSAGTSSFNSNKNIAQQDFNRSINSQFTSNVSYSQRFQRLPLNLSMNGRHSQNIQTGRVSMSLPDVTLNMNRFYPMKSFISNSSSPLAKLGASYRFNAKNELTNAPINLGRIRNVWNAPETLNDSLGFTLENMPEIIRRSKIGGQHTIPINTSIPLKNFSINPSFNYKEYWYHRKLEYEYLPEEEAVRIDTVNGFSRAGSWTSGASLNTIIYGTYFSKKEDPYVQAIRHVMTPALSFTYNPDFSTPGRGTYSYVQTGPEGDSVKVSKFEGFAYGSPTGSESKSIGISLQNSLEFKVRDKEDTTGIGFKKVKLFENLALSSGYNLALDSFQLSDIRFSTRTSFFDGAVSANLSGALDPYTYVLESESISPTGNRTVLQTRQNKFAWETGNGLGQLKSINVALSMRLKPRKGKDGKPENQPEDERLERDQFGNVNDPNDPNNPFNELTLDEEEELRHIQQNPDEYVDFNIPWDLRASYSVNLTRRGFEDPTIRQTLTFSGNITITPKTKIGFNSGFDIQKQTFTQTRLTINRDLHCWQMNFSWVPFGRYQSFSIVLRPKSSMLQDLKLQKRKNFLDFF